MGEVSALVVKVNISDGYESPYADDLYAVDFVAGTTQFNDEPPEAATTGELQSLAALVRDTPYRTIDYYGGVYIDGGSYPPTIIVKNVWSTSREFGASDQEHAWTNHDVYGDVVSCVDFGAIHSAVLEILDMLQPPAACFGYGEGW